LRILKHLRIRFLLDGLAALILQLAAVEAITRSLLGVALSQAALRRARRRLKVFPLWQRLRNRWSSTAIAEGTPFA